MSRILWLVPTLPWPPTSGGRIRTSELLRGACGEHELHLWSVERPTPSGGEEPLRLDVVPEFCSELRLFPRSKPSWLQRLGGPLQQSWFTSASLRRALAKVDSLGFDLIHVDELCLIPSLPAVLSTSVVQHHHKLDLELCAALRPAGPRRQLEIARWLHLEQTSLRFSRHHIFCSDGDAQNFTERHPRVTPHIVPNGVRLRSLPECNPPREENHLLLLGSWDYQPNLSGLQAFLEKVWPALAAARPGLTLSIVGSGPRPACARNCGDQIQWIGEVPDVAPWLAKVSALVIPLEVGGGTRLKALDAAAHDCPIVSTRVGVEGIPFQEGQIQIAERLEDLAPLLISWSASDEQALSKAQAAGKLIRSQFHWSQHSKALAECWSSVIEGA